MQQILFKIREGIQEIFPSAMGLEVIPATLLNHIPDWDSMSSVNFKVYLEETFGMNIPDDLLEGAGTVGELVAFIRKSN